MRRFTWWLVPVLLLSTLALADGVGDTPTPFVVAAQQANSIVRVEVDRKDDRIWLLVVEVLRGKGPDSIPVASCIWDAVTWGRQPEGHASYLLLLRGQDEIMCGQINGLATISGGCIGILPVVDGSVPAEFASRFDGVTKVAIPLTRIKQELKHVAKNR